MTSADADHQERPGVRGDPPPLGQPGPRWDGDPSAREDAEPVVASPPSARGNVRASAVAVERAILASPGVLRVGGTERALAPMPARIAAYILDVLTIWVGLVIIASIFGGSMEAPDPGSPNFNEAAATTYLVGVTFQLGFYWLWNSLGWSPGKRLLGLRIVNDRGTAPGVGRGFARTAGPLLVGAASGVLVAILATVVPAQPALLLGMTPLYLNYLWPLWDTRRQTWHDKLASTYVVKADTDDLERPAGASPDRTSQ